MSWFEKLTGIRETGYEEVRAQLELQGQILRSRANGRSFRVGTLELVSLGELRRRLDATCRNGTSNQTPSPRSRLTVIQGDTRRLHGQLEYKGALFQVASQFNLLEMVSPAVRPEDGVGRYEHDLTQGPACAIAAGAATIYRNYFAPVGSQIGQRANRQLDGLADLGDALTEATGVPTGSLWQMKNGYALCTSRGLALINEYLASLDADGMDALRARLRIGLHWDVEVTDVQADHDIVVSQAFCSALPISYTDLRGANWKPFASLILDAAYEATLLAGALNARRKGSDKVLLTLVGGGAFGNERAWILDAIQRAVRLVQSDGLDIRIVSYGPVPCDLQRLQAESED